MADPIGRAVNTFAALKGMDLQQQQFDENRKYRGFQMDMLGKQNARAESSEARTETEHQNKLFDRRRDEANKRLNTYLQAAGGDESKVDWGAIRDDLAGYTDVLPASLAAIVSEKDPQALAQKVEAKLAGTNELLRQMLTGDFDHDKAVPAANAAFSDELDARGRKYGAKQLRIGNILPSPQGNAFMFDAEVTRADGTTYRAPLTEKGGTAEQGDNVVMGLPVEKAADYLVSQKKSLEGIIRGYLTAQGVIKPKEDKWSLGGSGAVKINERTGVVEKTGYAKPEDADIDWRDNVLGPDGKPYQVGYRNGKEVARVPQWVKDGDGSGSGKTELIELKTGRRMTLADAKNSYLATFGKPDGMGGFVIDQSTSPPNFAEWINDQAKAPVFTADRKADPKIWAVAEEMADDWVKDQAGYFSSDDSDFRAFGGNRTQARAAKVQEFYAMLAGEAATGAPGVTPGGQAPGAPSGTRQAPPSAISALQANPSLIDQFETKYGYRPEGFDGASKGGASPTAKVSPAARGMTSPGEASPGPAAILGGMRANIPADNALTRANEAPVKVIQAGLNQLANYFVLDPARAAASDIAKPFKAFQAWAQTRYSTPAAEKDPQALAEYAKVDPESARKIEQAATQLASR